MRSILLSLVSALCSATVVASVTIPSSLKIPSIPGMMNVFTLQPDSQLRGKLVQKMDFSGVLPSSPDAPVFKEIDGDGSSSSGAERDKERAEGFFRGALSAG